MPEQEEINTKEQKRLEKLWRRKDYSSLGLLLLKGDISRELHDEYILKLLKEQKGKEFISLNNISSIDELIDKRYAKWMEKVKNEITSNDKEIMIQLFRNKEGYISSFNKIEKEKEIPSIAETHSSMDEEYFEEFEEHEVIHHSEMEMGNFEEQHDEKHQNFDEKLDLPQNVEYNGDVYDEFEEYGDDYHIIIDESKANHTNDSNITPPKKENRRRSSPKSPNSENEKKLIANTTNPQIDEIGLIVNKREQQGYETNSHNVNNANQNEKETLLEEKESTERTFMLDKAKESEITIDNRQLEMITDILCSKKEDLVEEMEFTLKLESSSNLNSDNLGNDNITQSKDNSETQIIYTSENNLPLENSNYEFKKRKHRKRKSEINFTSNVNKTIEEPEIKTNNNLTTYDIEELLKEQEELDTIAIDSVLDVNVNKSEETHKTVSSDFTEEYPVSSPISPLSLTQRTPSLFELSSPLSPKSFKKDLDISIIPKGWENPYEMLYSEKTFSHPLLDKLRRCIIDLFKATVNTSVANTEKGVINVHRKTPFVINIVQCIYSILTNRIKYSLFSQHTIFSILSKLNCMKKLRAIEEFSSFKEIRSLDKTKLKEKDLLLIHYLLQRKLFTKITTEFFTNPTLLNNFYEPTSVMNEENNVPLTILFSLMHQHFIFDLQFEKQLEGIAFGKSEFLSKLQVNIRTLLQYFIETSKNECKSIEDVADENKNPNVGRVIRGLVIYVIKAIFMDKLKSESKWKGIVGAINHPWQLIVLCSKGPLAKAGMGIKTGYTFPNIVLTIDSVVKQKNHTKQQFMDEKFFSFVVYCLK
ncbi:hypothetical protein ABK040_003341 [Willaertia magna]